MRIIRDNWGSLRVLIEEADELAVVLEEHKMVHAGCHYFCEDSEDGLNSADVKEWLIITPAAGVPVHFEVYAVSALTGIFEFFEEPTIAANGNALDVFNSNRTSLNTTFVQVLEDPTITVDGTRLTTTVLGGGRGIGLRGGVRIREDEIVLAPGIAYLARFTSRADNNMISVSFDWYEI